MVWGLQRNTEKASRGDSYAHHLGSGDTFTGVYVYVETSNCTF